MQERVSTVSVLNYRNKNLDIFGSLMNYLTFVSKCVNHWLVFWAIAGRWNIVKK